MRLLRRLLVALVLLSSAGWLVAQYVLGPPSDLDPPVLRELSRQPGPSSVDPGWNLRGVVLDHAGQPVQGALVWTEGAAGGTSWDLSDAEGRYVLSHLSPGEVDLRFAGTTIPHGQRSVQVPATTPIELNLPVPSADPDSLPDVQRSNLAGQVRMPEGQEVAGLEVLLLPIGRDPASGMETIGVSDLDGRVPRRALCDERGLFRFEGAARGRYLAAVLPDWAAGRARPRLLERPIDHGDSPVDHILSPSSGGLSGRVLDATGQALDGAVVSLWPASDQSELWPSQTSSADGSYRFAPLPEGSYRIQARAGERTVEELVRVAALREVQMDLRWGE